MQLLGMRTNARDRPDKSSSNRSRAASMFCE